MQLDIFTSQNLRDKGIQQAINHADEVQPLWSEQAYNCLLNYIRYNDEFMTEDVREASKNQKEELQNTKRFDTMNSLINDQQTGLLRTMTKTEEFDWLEKKVLETVK